MNPLRAVCIIITLCICSLTAFSESDFIISYIRSIAFSQCMQAYNTTMEQIEKKYWEEKSSTRYRERKSKKIMRQYKNEQEKALYVLNECLKKI